MVYDLTSFKSFDNLDFWIEAIKNATSDNIMIYLMGNKVDLIHNNSFNKNVTRDMINNFMSINSNIIQHYECSAKTKTNLVEPFESLCKGNSFSF